MNAERLFRVLVVGGSMMVGGCGSKTPPAGTPEAGTTAPAEPTATTNAEATPEALDCATICQFDSDVICPDANMDGAMGCCWLMIEPHPCCDYEPGLDGE